MPIPFRLDYVIHRLAPPPGTAERLGRDVGLRVAAVDHFENVGRPAA